MKSMTNAELNDAISELDDQIEGIEKPVFYWGWAWRDVDFLADHVYLAWSPEDPPDWHYQSAEHLLGMGWAGKRVGFCENNKWGYEMFKVEGEDWTELRRLIRLLLFEATAENSAAVTAFMLSLAP